MISGSNDVDAQIKEKMGQLQGNTKTSGQVLTIGDHKIKLQVVLQKRQLLLQDPPPWLAYHIAEYQYFYGHLSWKEGMKYGLKRLSKRDKSVDL